LTALTALRALAQLTASHYWLQRKSSSDFVVFAGSLVDYTHYAHVIEKLTTAGTVLPDIAEKSAGLKKIKSHSCSDLLNINHFA